MHSQVCYKQDHKEALYIFFNTEHNSFHTVDYGSLECEF